MALAPHDRRQLVWPAVGIVLGALVAINPFYAPEVTLPIGIGAWCVDMALVFVISARPTGARMASLLAGLFLAIPCFLDASSLSRGLLMCGMAAPFLAATALAFASPLGNFRARVAYLLSWCGTREVKRLPRSLNTGRLLQLVAATVVLAAAIAVVKAVPASGPWPLARWLAGGIMIFAFGEMATAGLPLVSSAFGLAVPQLMRSPYRSMSVGEFWSERWNVCASQKIFRPFCFSPLARHGVTLALFVVFALSGVAHALLAYMALGQWSVSLMCGTFFVVQPPLILAERRLAVRRWQPAMARVWTLTVLALTSPLFVEPALQLFEKSWGAPNNILLPTAAVLIFVIAVSGVISLASLMSFSSVSVSR